MRSCVVFGLALARMPPGGWLRRCRGEIGECKAEFAFEFGDPGRVGLVVDRRVLVGYRGRPGAAIDHQQHRPQQRPPESSQCPSRPTVGGYLHAGLDQVADGGPHHTGQQQEQGAHGGPLSCCATGLSAVADRNCGPRRCEAEPDREQTSPPEHEPCTMTGRVLWGTCVLTGRGGARVSPPGISTRSARRTRR